MAKLTNNVILERNAMIKRRTVKQTNVAVHLEPNAHAVTLLRNAARMALQLGVVIVIKHVDKH